MAKTRISIIVPMYNVAPFIEECLHSLWNQDLSEDEYEVVIINDGSADESLTLAQAICAQHSNVQLISQENKGLSEARNAGLAKARGEYIWFVDADDRIAPGCLSAIGQKMDEFYTEGSELNINTAKYESGVYVVKSSEKTLRFVVKH